MTKTNQYIKFTPTPGKMVVRRAPDRKQFESHLKIETPDTAAAVPTECEVIAVGAECPGIEVGSTVLVGAFSGVAVEFWGSTYLLVLFDEVMTSISVESLVIADGDEDDEAEAGDEEE